jgi:hypothetical protein
MPLLAQLGDLFGAMTWVMILVAGLLSPLFGLTGHWVLFREPVSAKRWPYLAVYYSVAILLSYLCFMVPINVIPEDSVNLWEACTFLPLLLLAALGVPFGLRLLFR